MSHIMFKIDSRNRFDDGRERPLLFLTGSTLTSAVRCFVRTLEGPLVMLTLPIMFIIDKRNTFTF